MDQGISVYFNLVPYSGIPSNTSYQHTCIALAEGFKELGIEFYSNCQYWYDWEKGEFLFRLPPVDFKANIHIYSVSNVDKFGTSGICKESINILLDDADGIDTYARNSECSKFDLILRSHYNSGFKYLSNVRPWAFGLTNRLMIYNLKYRGLEIKPEIFSNLRVPQNVRELANKSLLPKLITKYPLNNKVTDSLSVLENKELDVNCYWNQTGRRHNEDYFKILNGSLLTFAFGGISERCVGDNGTSVHKLRKRMLAKLHKTFGFRQKSFYYIHNFDNWRFWEALASNTCPIAINFGYWNCVYPEMPQPGQHYIGVEDYFFKSAADGILKMDKAEILNIAEAGRQWVFEKYSPVATANRLLKLLVAEKKMSLPAKKGHSLLKGS